MIALLTLLLAPALAQEAVIEDVMNFNYPGMHHIDGELYFTLDSVRNTTDRDLHVVGPDLSVQDPIRLKLGRFVDVRESRASGNNRYLWIASDKNGMLFQFDKAGKETGRRTFLMTNNNLNRAHLFAANEGGLVTVAQKKVKKVGKVIEVQGLDTKLGTTWTQQLQVVKKGLKLRAAGSNGERVAVVAKGINGIEVIAVSHTGKELYRTVLDGGDKKLFPSHLAVHDDGTVGVFGIFEGTGAIRASDKPGQYFMAVIDPSGKATVSTETWDLSAYVSASTDSSLQGPNWLHLHELVSHEDGFRLLAETYSWTGGLAAGGDMPTVQSTPQRFTAIDFVQVDFAKDAQVIGSRVISKPARRTSTLSSINSFSAESVSTYLAKYDRLSYQFTAPGGMTVLTHDSHNLLKVSCLAAGDERVSLVKRNHLGLHGSTAGASSANYGLPFKSDSLEYETLNSNISLRNTNVLPAGKDAFVVAHYDGKAVRLHTESCATQGSDDLLQGVASWKSDIVRPLPGGGAYAMYRVESGVDGFDRYMVVMDAGDKVHRTELDLPPSSIARIEGDRSVLFVHRLGSVHHLAAVDRMGELRTATLDLSGKEVVGANYLAAGDTFVVATRFRADKQHSYTVNWLDQGLQFAASSDERTGEGRLGLQAVGASSEHVAFIETWTADDGKSVQEFVSFDRKGKEVRRLPMSRDKSKRTNLISGGGVLFSRWMEKGRTLGYSLDSFDPAGGSVDVSFDALEKALSFPGLAGALGNGDLRLRFIEAVPDGDSLRVVAELVKTQGSAGEYGFSTDYVVLEVSRKGKVALKGGVLIPVSPSKNRNRYRGLVPGPDGLDLVFLELAENQWVSAAVALSMPTVRRVGPAGLPKSAERPSEEFRFGFEIKLEQRVAKLERGAARLQKLLGFEEPPAQPPALDANTNFVPVGDGRVRVYRYHPKWHTLEWRTTSLQ